MLIQRHRQPVMDAGIVGQAVIELLDLLGQLGIGAGQWLDQGDVGRLAVAEDHDTGDGRAELGFRLDPLGEKLRPKAVIWTFFLRPVMCR